MHVFQVIVSAAERAWLPTKISPNIAVQAPKKLKCWGLK